MKSMTGYAVGESENNVFSASLEIKGYNSRFLDIAVYMPAQYSCIENNIRKAVLQFCLRGKVDITIRIKEKQNNMPVCISEAAAGAYLKAAETLRRQMQSAYEAGETMLQPENKLPIAAFLGLEGILETERPPAPSEMFQDFIMPLLLDCLKQFDAARAHEGAETAAAIAEYVLVLNTRIALIERFSDTIENTIKSNIKARFEELLKDRIDEQRVLTETAALLMKCTIAEELSRLKGHLNMFSAVIKEEQAPSKKLEFICQEINREVNTIGSKSPLLEVSRAVVDCKEALENIREQLRNVE